MRHVLQIDSHTGFHLAALRTVLAGGLLALLGHHLGPPPWALGLLSVLLLGAALVPPRSPRQGALLVLLGLCGAGAGALGARSPLLGGIGQALALGLCAALLGGALPGWQRAATGAATALLSLGAWHVPPALLAQDCVAELPGALGPVLAGMGAGLCIGSAALLRRLRVALDPVDGELLALLPKGAEDEIGRLVLQAFTSYKEVAAALAPYPQARAAAEDLVKKIARFGRKWREIEEQVRKSDRGQLEARLGEIEQRLAATQDEQARAEYERAQGALAGQIAYLREIDAGRERAVARLHHQVATLERLRLAALRHRSVDAGKLGEELKAVVEDLGRAGQELDAAAEALAETPV